MKLTQLKKNKYLLHILEGYGNIFYMKRFMKYIMNKKDKKKDC